MLCTDWRVVIFIGQLTRPCTCCANVYASLTGRRQLKTYPKNRGSRPSACHRGKPRASSLSLSFIFPRRLSSTYLRLLSPPLSLSLSDRSSERGENLVWSARGWRGRGNHNEETLIRGNFPHAAAVKQTLIIPEHFAATTHSRRVFTGSRYNVKSRQNGEKKYLKKRYARSRGCKENIYRRLPSKNFSSLPIPRDFTLDISCFQPVNSGQIFRRICPKAFHLVCVCIYTYMYTCMETER